MKTDVMTSCPIAGSLNLSATLLDCQANDEIVWSITKAQKIKSATVKVTDYSTLTLSPKSVGSVASTGKTTAKFTPKNLGYDYDVAIRTSLKSDPKKAFAVTVVHVKK